MNWGQSVRKRAAELAFSTAGAGETTSQQPETKRKRGRPEGTYGSKQMRAFLQQARENVSQVDEVIPILDDDDMEENHGANLSLRSLSSRFESASSKLPGSHFQTLGRMLLMFQ